MAQIGVCSAGFRTMVLPVIRAGATFQAGMAKGKFHGVMSPTTPRGRRCVKASMFGRIEGRLWPPRRRPSPAT
ncbi:hypothetical protein D3C72_1909880 [compost metagenome]